MKPTGAPTEWGYNTDDKTWTLIGKHCYIWMDERPPYCDRGRWLARLEVFDWRALHIDAADGWPRYYFDFERAKAEIEAWMRNRKEWID